jgi:hypothetical protein
VEVGGDGQPPFHWRGILDGTWKSVRRRPNLENDQFEPPPILDPALEGASGEKIPFDRLFHLGEDPAERHDRIALDPAQAERLWEEMKARGWYFTEGRALEFSASRGADTDLELLQALGYAGETRESKR